MFKEFALARRIPSAAIYYVRLSPPLTLVPYLAIDDEEYSTFLTVSP